MANKGDSKIRDFIKSTESVKTTETDTLSTVDQGCDFVKAGESVPISHSGHKQ